MKKFLTVLAGFFIGFYVFMPKAELFYLLQKKLAGNKINLTANTESRIFQLNLSDGKIYYSSIKTAEFKNASLNPYIVYNRLDINGVSLPVADIKINKISLIQNILHPFSVNIKAESNFAKDIYGKIDLSKREIRICFTKIKNSSIKRFLKKEKKGYCYYEKF
jgi:hypothetical protein